MSRVQMKGCMPKVVRGKKAIRGECGGSCSVVDVDGLFAQDSLTAAEASYLCSHCKSHTLRSVGRPLRMFFYEELKAATNNFAYENCLAEPGLVFKGVLEGGSKLVAVKVVRDESAFHSQINILDRIHSPLIVGLIGYCDHEQDKKLLVYDFICNGSLEWHLTSSTPNVMPWATRKAIAISIGKGVRCMHTGSSSGSIQHQDLRSRHILLTHDFTPIIGGMSYAKWKSCDEKNTQLLRPPQRTGYSAPEHLEGDQELTEKVDVYSYGVILLELITGRKAFDPSRDLEQHILTEWACPLLAEFDYQKLVDPNLGHQFNHYELLSMMTAAAMCLRKNVTSRPSISTVLGILEDGGDKVGAAFNSDSEGTEDSDGHSSVSVPLSPPCHIVDRKVKWVNPTLHRTKVPVRKYRSRGKLSYNEMMLQ